MTMTRAEQRAGWVADDSTFGARLALIRQRMGWGNVKAAADACDQPVQSWRTWERDNVTPRQIVRIAREISEATGCDYIWLLTGGGSSGVTFEGTQRVVDRPMDTRPKGRPSTPSAKGPKSASRRPARIPRPVA